MFGFQLEKTDLIEYLTLSRGKVSSHLVLAAITPTLVLPGQRDVVMAIAMSYSENYQAC